MAEIAIFQDDAFGVAALTAAINEQEYVPGRLAALGLFQEEGVATLIPVKRNDPPSPLPPTPRAVPNPMQRRSSSSGYLKRR